MLDLGGSVAAVTLLLCVPVAGQSLNVDSAADDPSRNVVSAADTALRYVPQPSVISGSNPVVHPASNISILGDDYQDNGDATEADVSMCGSMKQICWEI